MSQFVSLLYLFVHIFSLFIYIFACLFASRGLFKYQSARVQKVDRRIYADYLCTPLRVNPRAFSFHHTHAWLPLPLYTLQRWLNFDYSKALWWRVVDVTPIREQNCRTNKSSVPEFPSPTLITYTYNLYFPWKFNPACCKFRSLKRMSVYNNSSHSSLSFPLFLRLLFSFPTRQRPLKRRSLCILRSQGERDGFTRF